MLVLLASDFANSKLSIDCAHVYVYTSPDIHRFALVRPADMSIGNVLDVMCMGRNLSG